MMDAKTRKMAVDLINDAIEKKGGYVGTKRPAYSTRQQYGGQYGRQQYGGRTRTRSSQPDILAELDAIEKMTPDQAYRYSVSTSGRANVYGRDGRMLSGADRERADVAHALAAMPEKQFRQFSGSFQGKNPTVAQMSQKLRSSPEYGGVAFSKSRNNLRGAAQNPGAGAGSFKMQRNNTTTGPYSGSIAARNAYVGKGTYVFGDVPQSAIAKAQSYRMPTSSYSMPARAFGDAMSRSYASNNAKSYSNRVYAANQRNAARVRPSPSPRMQLAGPSCRTGSRAGCRTMQPIKHASAHGLGLAVDNYISRFLEKRSAALPRDKRTPINWDAVRKAAPDIDKPVQTTGGGAWSEFGQNLSSQSGNAVGAFAQGALRAPGLASGLLGGAAGFLGNAVRLRNPLTGAYNGFNTAMDFVDNLGGNYSLGSMRNGIQKYRDWTRDDYIKRNNIDTSQEGKWDSLDGWALRGTNMASGAMGAAGEMLAFDGIMSAVNKALGATRNVVSKMRGPKPPAGAPPAGTPPAGAPPAGTPPAGTPPAGAPPAGTPPAGTPPAGTPPAVPKPPAGAPAPGTPTPTPGAPAAPAAPGKLKSVFNSGKELTKDTYNLATKKIPGTDISLANTGFNYWFMYRPNADMPEYIREKEEYDRLMANPENRYDPAEEMRRRSQAPAGSSYNVPGWHPSNSTSNPYLDLDVSSYM